MDHATKQRISSLLPKLAKLEKDGYKLQRVRKDLSFIKKGLETIQSACRGDSMGEDDKTKEEWSTEAMELTYDIEPVIDKLRACRLRSADQKGCMSFKGAACGAGGQSATTSKALSTKKLGNDIHASVKGVKELAGRSHSTTVQKRADEAAGGLVEKVLIGILKPQDGNGSTPTKLFTSVGLKKVLGILKPQDGSPPTKLFHSIAGPNAVGNTEVAKVVYDMVRKKQDYFSCAAWVTVSAEADIKKALWSVLCQISQQDGADFASNVEDIIGLIRKALKDKKYLIVVDNIQSQPVWDTISPAFSETEDIKGSAVLLTTTSLTVPGSATHKLGAQHKLQRVISRKDQYEDSNGGTSTRRGILGDLSDTSGRPHQTSCLLYLSMFQKGSAMSVDRLVSGWIAEGFIPEKDGRKTGELYLRAWFGNGNFTEEVETVGGGKVVCCLVDDYDKEVSLQAQENFATIVVDKPLAEGAVVQRRLSIQGNGPLPPKDKLSRVRSLVVSGDAKEVMPSLSFFEDLLVLDLVGCESLQDDQLKGIENLTLLRYLAVRGNGITFIPKEIGQLVFLQTLDLRATSVKELPASIARARKLKRLYVSSGTMIPDWIGNLSKLEELGDINICKPELMKELCSLARLIILGIAIWSWDESYNKPLLEYLNFLSKENKKIQGLSILTCCSPDFLDAGEFPTECLQRLEIRHGTFHRLPRWFSSLQMLSSLSIQVYNLSKEIIDTLGKLGNLNLLSLTSKSAPEAQAKFDNTNNSNDAFRSLTSFHFVTTAMGKIFGPGAMPKLTTLKLSFQASLTKDVPPGDFEFGLENLSSVRIVRVEINCFNATCKMVSEADTAIRNALASNPDANLEIDRVQDTCKTQNGEKEEQDMTQNGQKEESTKMIPTHQEEVILKQEQQAIMTGNIILATGMEKLVATKYSISGTLTLQPL